MPVACGAIALGVNLALLPRAPGIGDGAEFTLALALGGVPHPTGYPLYVLLGTPFVRALHALGLDWVRAAGAWSALGAAVAIGFFAALMAQLAGLAMPGHSRRHLLAVFTPVLVLALHPVWLRAATEPEVYSWWFAWLAGAAWFCIAAIARLDDDGEQPHGTRVAFTWGALCGLGIAHHALSLLFAAPLSLALFAALRQRGTWRASMLLPAALGAVLPLASWGFLAWRAFHPAVYQWPLDPSFTAVWDHIRGAAYTRYLGGFAPKPAERALLARTLLPLVIPGLAFSTLAALRVTRPVMRGAQLALVLGAALLLAFTLNYGVPDPAMYCVPVLMVALFWLPAMLAPLESSVPRALAAAALVAIGVSMAAWGVAETLEHRARLARIDTRIRAAWDAIPFERGVVLWKDDHCARLVLFQLLEHSHAERIVANPTQLTWSAGRLRFVERAGFDPLSGLRLRTRADLAQIPANVRRQTPLPVVEFQDVLGHEAAKP